MTSAMPAARRRHWRRSGDLKGGPKIGSAGAPKIVYCGGETGGVGPAFRSSGVLTAMITDTGRYYLEPHPVRPTAWPVLGWIAFERTALATPPVRGLPYRSRGR